MSVDRLEFVRRQRVLADFGELALRSENLQEILDEGCRLVAEALGAELAKIVEIEHGPRTALVRAGVGWQPGVVGETRFPLSERSSESYSIEHGKPVLVRDIAADDRFDFPEFLRRHGVLAMVNAPIFLPGGQAFGLLQVDAREPRAFGDEDVEFLRTYCMVLGPVIDRLRTTSELKRSNERFRLVVESARDYAIILSDPEDRIVGWFPGAAAIFGWTEEEMVGQPVDRIFTPEDRAHGVPRGEVERARRDGAAPNVRWHLTKDGARVFLDGQTIVLRNDDGSVRGFLKIGQNITERKRAEERREVLQQELQHRVRNVLAMIASVVARGDVQGTAQAFQDSLKGRIAAMARTQVLLTRGHAKGVDLEGMIRDELSAQSAGEHPVSVRGPAVLLAPKAAEVLTLAIHELITNAAKYGAFAQPHGCIDVAWRHGPEEGPDWLELVWRESGVLLSPRPDRQEGFGTELIVRRVPYELRGRGALDLRPTGLHCRIAFPLLRGESVLQTDIPAGSEGAP